jgi:uncharacterized protein YjiS (DUF1127 family)
MTTAHGSAPFGTLFSTLTAFVSPVHQSVTRTDPLYDRIAHLGLRFDHLGATLATWSERARMRRELRRLDDHLLDDVGLSREQIAAEIDKPFWRA